MNFRNISVIIRREYLNKVKKKSFLITTFVVPILMAALVVVPIVIAMTSKEKVKRIAVIDESGIVMPVLDDSDIINYEESPVFTLDSLKNNLSECGFDAVLHISAITEDKSVTADITSQKPMGVMIAEQIGRRIEDAVEDYRVASYNIEGLADIINEIKPDVELKAYTIDEKGEEKESKTEVYAFLSMFLGIFLFLFITLFGGMVMSAVIEEKTSRVVEVLVSSVKATELMFGKIIGIALVAITQFLLWIVLTIAIITAAGNLVGQDILSSTDPAAIAQTMGADAAQIADVAGATGIAEGGEIAGILSTVRNLPLGEILVAFLIFFIFGYLLYASMFAAIGSAVENEGDTQQLQMPLTIPLLIGYIIALYAFKAPDSPLAFWGSIIPFTSPIVMIARIPFGVPFWELALSIALLVLTFVVFAWLSAKIYKVGILMFGKKSTWKDLWKWLKQN